MKIVVFANGSFTAREHAKNLCEQAELIIAVDGGIRHCEALGIQPDILLGDLDSAPADCVDRASVSDVALLRYPGDKDKTDLELALDCACSREATTVSLFGALGGRWDMSLANLLLPAAPAYKHMRITLYDDQTRIDILRSGDRRELSAPRGSRVSLIPLNGEAEGVTLSGFKYPLTDQNISFASTQGISNCLVDGTGTIALHQGQLLCILSSADSAELGTIRPLSMPK